MRRLTLEPGVAHTTDRPGPALPEVDAITSRVADPTTSLDDLGRLLAQAADLVAGRGDRAALMLDAEPAPDDLDAIARSAGFALTRTLLQMRRPLPMPEGDRGGSGALPPVRAFRPGVDDDAWLTVNNRAFAWHPEQGGWTREDLAERMSEPWFRADGFLLHDADHDAGDGAGRAIDAFCWTKIHADHDPPLGEIYVIGVDPDAHGRGLGRALTLAGLDWLAAHGLTIGMLYVEADNDAGVGLYRDLGFTEHLVHRWWRAPA